MKAPQNLDGLPGVIVDKVKKASEVTQIFPPMGVGLGAGLGLGCGVGWPVKQAIGPPRAFCGPGIGVGVGFGYGQGFGRRFGKDRRSPEMALKISRFESALDQFVIRTLALVGYRSRKEKRMD